MSKKILITGGAGFIGSHIAERLCKDNEVILFDNLYRNALEVTPSLKDHPHIKVIQGDILDKEALQKAFAGIDTVIHLAAIVGVSSYYADPVRLLDINVIGTLNALDAVIKQKVGAFVFFSTSEVYGPNAMWVNEESLHGIGPTSDKRWCYATSKLAGEQLSMRYAEKYGFACTVVHPFNIYGPRQVGEGVIPNFARAVATGKPMMVYGDGSPIRAYCYISDLVDGVEAILTTPEAQGQVFNIGNPQEIETSLGLAKRIARMVPGTEIQLQNVVRHEVLARVPVIDKAKRILKYQPKVDLEEGLKRTLSWFQEMRK